MNLDPDPWDRPSFDLNVTLFTLAVRESAADRRYAEQLHLPG